MTDAVIQPLEVFILDANFNRLTGSIPYDSLIWHRRYYGVGEFQMQVRSSLYDPSWRYVYADDRPETGIIQKVEYDDTTEGPANGEDTIIISGFFLEELLNRLVFLVEESETEEIEHTEIIPKPIRGSFPTPTYYQDENGDYYVNFNGNQWNNCMTGEGYRYEWDPEFFDSLTEADVQPGEGMYQQVIHYGPGFWPGGKSFDWVTNMWSTSYSYVSEDGKLTIINGRDNVSGVYDIVGDTSSGSILYKDTDGSVKWVNGAVESFDDTYRRKMQRWEFAKTREGAEIDDNGNVVIRWTEYREVEGPWMLRTDLDDVSTPQDNVQWILKMTQKIFQGNFIYDKVGFTGETKTLTPSLTKIGDFFFQELQTVEASLRVMYHFESNQMIFQLWRGIDRTQEGGGKAPWAVFSDTWGTLYGYSASHDESNYRNKCYVLYEYDEPVWDADGNVAIDKEPVIEEGDTGFAEITGYTYTTSTERKRGYLTVRLDDDREDAEIWSDQRSASPDFMDDAEFGTYESEEDVPEYDFTEADFEAWVESLKTDAEKLLKTDYCDVDNLDTGTISTLRYFYDFDLGDKVDIAVEAIGMSKTARITEVEEVYESGSADIRLTMGEELLSTSKKSLLI